MKNYIVRPLTSRPGIQRDGTQFASQSYIDGQWCRFYMGRPRKMGGYELIDPGNTEIIRSLFGVAKPNSIDLYLGRASSLSYNHFDLNGNGTGEIDRTPVGYTPNPNNVWDFDLFTNTNGKYYIIAAAIANGNDVSNTTPGNVYYGDINSNTPLIPVKDAPGGNPITTSGGVVFSSPLLIVFGNDGVIRWSNPGDITSWPSSNYSAISNTKIIQAYRTRGSTTPQILCWTLSSLINVTYIVTGTPPTAIATFAATTIQDDITVMSPNSIVQYNQQFFWIGIDQFYVFNGIVQRLDNSMSSDWFFNNVNLQQRSKIWGMVIPRYKEIWWFYPRNPDDPNAPRATECNAVVIYNTELGVWYDSMISRAAGLSPSIFSNPLMSDSALESVDSGHGVSQGYGIWEHEVGVDKFIGGQNLAINSYFETSILTLFENNPDSNRLIRSRRIEPDFSQTGDITVTVNNRMFASDTIANGNLLQTGPFTFNGNTRKVDDVTSQGRLVSFVFQSNVAGGFYQGGQTLLDYEIGDVNP